MKYASIVPLIGGETFGMQNVFNKPPEYVLSYKGFEANDKQLLNYYNDTVPYILLDEASVSPNRVDVLNAVCPCAGLSSLSTTSSSSSPTNDWMLKSAKYVLENIQPTVFWGENAPRLASKMGEPIVKQMRAIAKENGYVISLYKTKSILHGLSQVRERIFYFFWKGNKVPVFEYYRRPYTNIADQIRSSARNDFDPMNQMLVKASKPSEDPFYKYVLEEIHGGITHTQFQQKIEKTWDIMHYIEDEAKVKYDKISMWLDKNGYTKQAKRAMNMYDKLESGGNIMRRGVVVPKDYIGAFVGAYPHQLTHPDADRYLNVRECLDIMKMPKDFQLMGGTKNLNMICQNVPVTTAADMAENVKRFLKNEAKLIETDFVVQNNKDKTMYVEEQTNSLEAFL
jgi:site-specific DNA-cytosine methylase